MSSEILTLVITARKRSFGKVMFLNLSVSHSVHGGVSQHASQVTWAVTPLGRHTLGQSPSPPGQTPLWADIPPGQTPPEQTPPGADPHRMVSERAVRILLECILVRSKGLFTRCDRDYDPLSKQKGCMGDCGSESDTTNIIGF